MSTHPESLKGMSRNAFVHDLLNSNRIKPLKAYLDLTPASKRLTPSFIDAEGLKASQPFQVTKKQKIIVCQQNFIQYSSCFDYLAQGDSWQFSIRQTVSKRRYD